jgi:hypothetical protein
VHLSGEAGSMTGAFNIHKTSENRPKTTGKPGHRKINQIIKPMQIGSSYQIQETLIGEVRMN